MNVNVNIKDLPLIGKIVPNTNIEMSSEEAMYKKLMIENYIKELEQHPEEVRNFTSISMDLTSMGYKPEIFTACFLVHKFTTLEEAIDILGKTDGLWNHRYVNFYKNQCFICNEDESTHRTFGNILQRKQSKLKEKDNYDSDLNRSLIRTKSSVLTFKREESVGQVCEICLDAIPKGTAFSLKCQHKFCQPCVQDYVREEIMNARIKNIKCPQGGCHENFNEESIKSLVNEPLFIKYQKFLERERIKNDKTLFFCPFPNCEGYAKRKNANEKDSVLSIEVDNANSPLMQENNNNISHELDKVKYTCTLGHDFCGKCKRLWHEDECLEDKELREASEVIHAIVKRCPKCKIPINKFAGCNHITCPCGHQFCWICYQDYTEDHYSRPGTPCYGFQFDIPYPELVQIRNFVENHEIIVFFIFIFFYSFALTSQLVRRTFNPENGERGSKVGTYVMILFSSFTIFLFSALLNLFFLINMINGLVKTNIFIPRRHNFSKMLLVMVYFLLYFILFFPGILFSAIWFIFINCYALVKIIVA